MVGLAILAAGCGSSGGRTIGMPGRLVGCYALFDGAGRPASDSLYYAPARVRLDTEPARPPEPRTWMLQRLDGSGTPVHDARAVRSSTWSANEAGDSVRILFHTGFSGTEFFFAVPKRSPGTLRGRAVEHWDFAEDSDAVPASAVRVACAEP